MEINTVQGSVNTLNISLNERLTKIEAQQRTNASNIETLENNVTISIGKIAEIQTRTLEHEDSILEEVEERLSKRNNVLLFNVPEPAPEGHEFQADADSAFVSKLCVALDVDADSPSLSSVSRIGKYSPSLAKPRPLKVVFANQKSTDLMIQKFIKIKKSKQHPAELKLEQIIISSDRTQRQRNQHRSALEELQRRTKEGESNLRLVIRHGKTSIVNKRPPSQMD